LEAGLLPGRRNAVKENAWIWLIAAGVLLSMNPRCNRGCRTLAQHLIEHGIDDFIAGLL